MLTREISDWLLVHACSLLVFAWQIDVLPRETTVGVPTVVVIAGLVVIAGAVWVTRSVRGDSNSRRALAFVAAAVALALAVAGVGHALGAVYREHVPLIAPLVAGLSVVPVAVLVWTRRAPDVVALTRDLRTALLVQAVGGAVYAARYALYAWTLERELFQLVQVELVLVYPGLLYVRAMRDGLQVALVQRARSSAP